MITLHGIGNCDTVRKTRKWLQQHEISYTFRDLRAAPPSTEEINLWLQDISWQSLLNKRSSTWRALDKSQQAPVNNAETAAKLMATQPTLIKRPLLSNGSTLHNGFSEREYQLLLDDHFFDHYQDSIES